MASITILHLCENVPKITRNVAASFDFVFDLVQHENNLLGKGVKKKKMFMKIT